MFFNTLSYPPEIIRRIISCPQRGAWAFPLRYNVHAHVIVLSPGNYPQDNFLPPKGAWAFPLRYNVHAHVIVSSPGFSLWLNPAPRGAKSCPQRGRPSLNPVLSLKPTFNIVLSLRCTRCNYPLITTHYPLSTIH